MIRTNVTAYAQVNATTRALYANLLTPDVWHALIQAANFDALLTLLDKTAYSPFLKLDRQLLTPRRTVYQLRWHLTHDYEKLIRLTPEPACQLILQLWRLYEVDNLKATLRGVETGASWDEVRRLLSPMVRYITVNNETIQRMLASGSVVRAIERLRHTPYYETLIHALTRYEMEKNLFPLEVALDLDYRRGLWEAIQSLKGTDRDQALRLVGTSIDVDNLLWAMRYRLYHHLSVQEIINYTMPFGYQVRDEHIRALAEGADMVTIVKRIYPHIEGLDDTGPQSREEPPSPQRQLALIERALHRHIIRLCHKSFLGDPFHVGVQVAYLMLLEYELRDLTAIVEAKAAQLPSEKLTAILESEWW
ncbi:MAG TPA: V-type ATPase subunit [Anaerolineae bacterium]|nr:V-type ATPase subunit [Anaerolineae bacterium]HQK15236.1 V-type ATPase subunit [Anaerolineae bacterium]